MTIFGMIMTAVSSTLIVLYRNWQKQKDYLEVMQDAYWAVELISAEVRQSTDFSIRNAGSGRPKRMQLDAPYTAASKNVLYWRGTQTLDNENSTPGFSGFLYRGDGTETGSETCFNSWLCFWPLCYNAFDWRNIVLRFVADNPDSAFFAEQDGNLVRLLFTLRPKPDLPESQGNRNLVINTTVRRRNF